MRNFLIPVLSMLALYVSSAPIRFMGRNQNRRTRETAVKKAKTLIPLRKSIRLSYRHPTRQSQGNLPAWSDEKTLWVCGANYNNLTFKGK